MKKLLTIILILGATLVTTAQTQFVEVYDAYKHSDYKEWTHGKAVVVYNENDDSHRLRLHFKDLNLLFIRTSDFFSGETDSGQRYTVFEVVEYDTGSYIIIQKFEQVELGVRFVFEDLSTLTLSRY